MADDEITIASASQPYSFWGSVWDAALARKGIVSRRVHQSLLDMAAQDQLAAVEADNEIGTQLDAARESATTDTDLHQLEVLGSRQAMLRKLFGHPDPKVRAYAEEQMLDLNKQIGAYYEDVETRQEALTDEDRKLRLARGDEYRKTITTAQDRIREINTKADTLYGMVNDLGADNDAVQAFFRDMIGASAGDANRGPGAGINLFGMIHADLGNNRERLTRDQLIKGTAAWQKGQTGQLGQAVHQTIAAAEKDGYRANLEDGTVSLEDLNITPTSTPLASRPPLEGKPQASATEATKSRIRAYVDSNPLGRALFGAGPLPPQSVGASRDAPTLPPADPNIERIRRKYKSMRRPVN